MNLYLTRHAEALPVGGSINRDVDRILSSRGEADAMLMGRALSRIDGSITLILTSPLARAVRTGEIIRKELGGRQELRVTENLAPAFRHKSLLEELESVGKDSGVVAVGHQPDLSNFICSLIADSSRAAIAMESCAIVKITVQSVDGRCESILRWLLTPGAVKRILPQP